MKKAFRALVYTSMWYVMMMGVVSILDDMDFNTQLRNIIVFAFTVVAFAVASKMDSITIATKNEEPETEIKKEEP